MPAAFRVTGLREVTAGLRQQSKEAPRALRSAFLPIAQKVASEVQQKVPHRTGRAAASVKARAGQRGAAIAFGGDAAPYFPWLDFGGTVGRGHELGPWKGSIKRPWAGRPIGSGRYVYPTIEEQSEEIRRAAEDAVLGVARDAGFEVR